MPVKTYDPTLHKYDVLIIGAGGAGLRAAIAAAERNVKVAVVCKVPPKRSHTVAAQGGINAALGTRGADDWRWHMYDTIRGADWLGDQDAIAKMCADAPRAIRELEAWGVPFSRTEDDKIYQRAYGGQTVEYGKAPAYRACAAEDRTGQAMMHTLYEKAKALPVDFFMETLALDLVMNIEGDCAGVLAWELPTGALHLFQAQETIIATGGYGQVYAMTTAANVCTGDGNAMALRAGLPLQDMEFVQFHPTGLAGYGILITEGARGEGGFLRNRSGERFMEHYAPQSLELASRDVICRAMVQEIQAGRGCGKNGDHLLLDLTHLPEEVFASKLPYITSIITTFGGIDPRKQPVPVLPTVHYSMGGIAADANSQAVADASARPMRGLRVIGEAACNSTHGANRLGCNSLLDLIVFGREAGDAAAQTQPQHTDIDPASLERAFSHLDRLRHGRTSTPASEIKQRLQQAMHRHAPIYRSGKMLEAGLEELNILYRECREGFALPHKALQWNTPLVEAIETDNLLRQAMATLASAAFRTESRGAHSREDFPSRDDSAWLCHSLCWLEEDGTLRLDKRPVRTLEGVDGFTPEDHAHFSPQARNY